MYEELVKRLREADEKSACGECGLNLYTGATKKGVLFAEAADAIEEQQKEVLEWQKCRDLERYLRVALERKNPRWIPVTERLPDCEWGSEIGNVEWISHGCVYAGCFGRGGKWRDAYFRTWTDGTEGIDAKDAECWRIVQIPAAPGELLPQRRS